MSLDCPDLDYFNNYFNGKKLQNEWNPPELDIIDIEKPILDFISCDLSLIIINELGKEIIEPLITKCAQIIYLKTIKNTKLYAINVIKMVDCIDFELSDIIYDSDDSSKIQRIDKFYFDSRKVSIIEELPIFKIEQDPSVVFVTSKFIDIILKHKLRGIGFADPNKGMDYI